MGLSPLVLCECLTEGLKALGTFPSTPVFGLGAWRGQESGDLYSFLDPSFLGISAASLTTSEDGVWRRESRAMTQWPLKITIDASISGAQWRDEKL